MRKIFLVSLAVVAASTTYANSITTLFSGGNNGSAGGGVYFDIQVGANPIQITGFDVNTLSTSPTTFGFSVFTKPGTYSGSEGNAGAWTLQTEGSGTLAGANVPNPVTINSPFVLQANTLYGMAISLSGQGLAAASSAYTNGNGSNQFYSNSDLSLTLGSATNVLFGGTPFTPRVWNGTIHYNVVPEPASMVALSLGALALIRRRRK
jgi:hypothetical protein